MDSEEPKKKLLFCNQCRRETNHFLKGTHTSYSRNDSVWEERTAKLWICAGGELSHQVFVMRRTKPIFASWALSSRIGYRASLVLRRILPSSPR